MSDGEFLERITHRDAFINYVVGTYFYECVSAPILSEVVNIYMETLGNTTNHADIIKDNLLWFCINGLFNLSFIVKRRNSTKNDNAMIAYNIKHAMSKCATPLGCFNGNLCTMLGTIYDSDTIISFDSAIETLQDSAEMLPQLRLFLSY